MIFYFGGSNDDTYRALGGGVTTPIIPDSPGIDGNKAFPGLMRV